MEYQIQFKDLIHDRMLYSGPAQASFPKADTLNLTFGTPERQYEITLYSKGCRFKTAADMTTELVLRPKRSTKARIRTDFGDLEMAGFCHEYRFARDLVYVKYELKDGQFKQNFHFEINLKEQGEGNGEN